MVTRRSMIAGAASTAGAMLVRPPLAGAQQARFPERPVRFVVPFAPGGVYDVIGRQLSERLKSSLGTLVIENVPGAGGSRGASMVAQAQPDGHTLLVAGTSEQIILPLGSQRPPYDPLTDFEPVTRIGLSSLAFLAHPSAPPKNLADLVTYVKAKPGELSFGTPGAGTLHHLTGEMFNYLVRHGGIVHVPYSGAGPALNDLIGGHIQLAIAIVSAQILEFHKAGKLRMLAVTSPRRLAAVPEVPTAVESGLPDLISQFFVGILAPKGTPPEIVKTLNAAIDVALADKVLREQFEAASFEGDTASSPAALRAFMAAEIARWTPVVKASGFKLN